LIFLQQVIYYHPGDERMFSHPIWPQGSRTETSTGMQVESRRDVKIFIYYLKLLPA